MDTSATSAYGWKGWGKPDGTTISAETQIGMGQDLSAAVMAKLPFGHNNPLFWLLILFLVFTGWMYFGGSFGIKRLGSVSAKVGK